MSWATGRVLVFRPALCKVWGDKYFRNEHRLHHLMSIEKKIKFYIYTILNHIYHQLQSVYFNFPKICPLFRQNLHQFFFCNFLGCFWVFVCMHLLLASKKGKRKVQGVPQSQTAALPRPQEEEETDKSKQAQTEQTYAKRLDFVQGLLYLTDFVHFYYQMVYCFSACDILWLIIFYHQRRSRVWWTMLFDDEGLK